MSWRLPERSLACALLLLPSLAVRAHHSFAMFDMAHTQNLNATVHEVQWSNPHVTLWLETTDAAGATQLWSIESASPGNLLRFGWTRHSLKPGDAVQVSYHPMRDGRPGGALTQVTFTGSGEVLKVGAVSELDQRAQP